MELLHPAVAHEELKKQSKMMPILYELILDHIKNISYDKVDMFLVTFTFFYKFFFHLSIFSCYSVISLRFSIMGQVLSGTESTKIIQDIEK